MVRSGWGVWGHRHFTVLYFSLLFGDFTMKDFTFTENKAIKEMGTQRKQTLRQQSGEWGSKRRGLAVSLH